MPKQNQGPDRGRVKIRVFEFEVEGANNTIIEGIKNFATVVSRGNGAVPAIKAVPSTNGNKPAALGTGVAAEEADEDDADIIEHEVTVTPSRPRAKRAVSSPDILDLDLSSGDMPLAKFVDEKKPDNDYKRYLVIAHWFKNHRATPNVTVNHIHTAYRHLGWSTPKNAAQPLRDLKSKNQRFGKGSASGEYAINHIGENVVNKMPNG